MLASAHSCGSAGKLVGCCADDVLLVLPANFAFFSSYFSALF
jgi:hypothetical protein